jgi:hypothetical protein
MINALNKHDVHVVVSQKTANPGISNINLQIITSGAGVVAARNLGVQFVLKPVPTNISIIPVSKPTYLIA